MKTKFLHILSVLVITFSLSSCIAYKIYRLFVPKRLFSEKSQLALFSAEKSDVRDYIDIDGYYRCDSDYYSTFSTKNMVIYDDWSFSFFDWKYDYGAKYEDKMEMDRRLAETNDLDIGNHVEYYCSGLLEGYMFLSGGAYKVEKGEIITETSELFNDERVICRNIFKILDRRTLRRERFMVVTDDSVIQLDTAAVFRFIPARNLPPSSLQLEKRHKWMWKNKEDWKLHKAQRKKDIQKFKEEHRPQSLQR